jgi:hypothetical protein
MRFRKASAALALSGILLAAPGCKDFFDVNTDPIHPTTAQLSQILPVSQVAMSTYAGFNIQGLGQPASAVMGQLQNGRGIGAYAQDQDAFGTPWSGLYTDMLQNNEQIIKQGTAEQNWAYVGIAQIQKAYVFSQLVDAFGDVPYSQALQGAANRYPRFDDDAAIYNGDPANGIQSLFSLIDEGIANLAKDGASIATPSADIMYGGNLVAWRHFGNSLKLKLYNQIRNVNDVQSNVQALMSANDFITSSENFEVKYGSSAAPENRHIGFLSDYVNTPPENKIGAYLYLLMRYGNGINYQPQAPVPPAASADPRIAYYFFNQYTSTTASPSFDYQAPGSRFVTVKTGSFGTTASTNISETQSLPGLYPYGGRYDNGTGVTVTEASAPGNGIQRLFPYFSQKFTEAELQLTVLNNEAAAGLAYTEAVNAAFDEVNKIVSRSNTVQPRNAYIDAPLLGSSPARTAILNKFTNATSKEDKLRVIMEQKYIASFGMGLDIFTDWRRTHYPVLAVASSDAIGTSLGLTEDLNGPSADESTRSTGIFPRRFYYPYSELIANTNPQAPKVNLQPQDGDEKYRIFWDK